MVAPESPYGKALKMDQEKANLKIAMSELYNTEILRLTTQIPHSVRLNDADVSVMKTSRICGSRITADAVLQNGVITGFGQEVKACALGQAAAAIVGKQVIGLSEDELTDIATRFRQMVKTGEVDYPEKWQQLSLLAAVKDHPGRHGSVMLPFEVLEQMFADSRAGSSAA